MSKTKAETNHDALVAAAEVGVQRCEALELGTVWATVCETAEAAIDELRRNCLDAAGFGALEPVGPEILAELESLLQPSKCSEVIEELVNHHSLALGNYPDLARALRSSRAIAYLNEWLGSMASRALRDEKEFAAEGVRRFELLASQALAEQGLEKPASETIAWIVPGMESQLAAVRSRHEEHARAELKKLAERRVEAERIISAERQDKQRKLDETAAKAEKAAANKRRLALHGRALLLADKIEKLAVKTIPLKPGTHYSTRELCSILRSDGFTEEKMQSIESCIDRFSKADVRGLRARESMQKRARVST